MRWPWQPRQPLFLVWAPPYTHRSAGIRALYRLCHHLNVAGYPAAMVTENCPRPEDWRAPRWRGPVADSIVVYPEVVRDPLEARRVVRWVLNDPGLLGGDTVYGPHEMVFVYDPAKLDVASRAAGEILDAARVLTMGLIDPRHIYPDPAVARTMDVSFTNKGRFLKERFPLPAGVRARPLEEITPSLAALGDALRRTRTLYSWDHYSNVLREAHVSGCDIRVVGGDGTWHDPRRCACVPNIVWQEDILLTYGDRFNDSGFVEPFIRELRRRWPDAARQS